MTLTSPSTDVAGGIVHRLLIGGEWREASAGRTFPVTNPATGNVLAEVPDAEVSDGLDALAAASAAQPAWAAVAPRRRGELLSRVYEAILERQDEIARLITAEMGKPLAEAYAEVRYGAEFFRWYAEEAVRISGRYAVAPPGGYRIVTVPRPVGVCVLVTPWNFPLAMGARKIAPALAAGCTAVVKPAEDTPLTMLYLARLLEDCGAPAGTVNVVTTTRPADVVDALLADRRTRKLSFTGSTEVGRQLLSRAAPNVLRTSMELGGNAPLIVCDDADLDVAVSGALLAKMRNMGESCVAANRIYVQEGVLDAFVEPFTAGIADLRVGNGADADVAVGPLIHDEAVQSVHALVRSAIADGARLACGGELPAGAGSFYPPTVLTDVPATAQILRREIFGPVAPIVSFRTDDEVIELANDTEYGLVGYVFTTDLQRALHFTERLEVGMVGVNRGLISEAGAPFGGVKHSGLGREGAAEGLAEYLDLTYAAVDLP